VTPGTTGQSLLTTRYHVVLGDAPHEDDRLIAFFDLAVRPDQHLAVVAVVEPGWRGF
jgi:hypothetical protein